MAKAVKNAIVAAVVVITGSYILKGLQIGKFAKMTWATISQYAMATAVFQFVASGIGMLLQKGIDAGADNFGVKTTVKGAANPRQIVYGECVVGGTLAYVRTSGTDNDTLHMVIMLAGHEIESLEKLLINGTEVATGSSSVSGETVYHVTTADFVNTGNPNAFTSGSLFRYTFHDGASDQDACGLASTLSDWGSNHRLRGIAYVYCQVVFDAEKWRGLPAISAKIKGKKVYDPRNTSTAWSANPALCIRDYLMDTTNGVGALSTEINDANVAGSFYTAANTCDTDVATTGGATEDKYTLNGFFNTSGEPQAILESMLSSCGGKISYANGKFNLYAGQTQTASLTITDDDIYSTVDIQGNRGDQFNGVKGIFVDKENEYEPSDMPPYLSSTYLNADTPSGGATANYERYLELQYPFTQSQFTGQRLSRIALNANRQALVVSMAVSLKFYQLQVGDWVLITNERMGWTSKKFEVQAITFEANEDNLMLVRLILKEIADSVFAFDTDNDYTDPPTVGSTPVTGSTTVTVPSSLNLTALSLYVINSTAVLASWTKADSAIVSSTELSYKKTADSDNTYQIQGNVPYAAAQQRMTLHGLAPNTGYTVRIRSYSQYYDSYSDYVTGTVTTGGTLVDEDDINNDNITIDSDGIIQNIGTSSVIVNAVKTTWDHVRGNASSNTRPADGATVGAVFGTNLYKTGTTNFTAAELKNDSQDWSDVGGSGKPADNATVGARLGTNLLAADGSTSLDDNAVRNASITLNAGGYLNNIGTTEKLKNALITTNTNGTLNYDGTSAGTPSLANIGGIVGKSGGGLGEDVSSVTGVLRMASGSLHKDTSLSTSYTDATNNGTTVDTNGNITGDMSCNATLTMGTSANNKIVCGNVTIDGETGRILIED